MDPVVIRFILHFDLDRFEERITVDIPLNENIYDANRATYTVEIIQNEPDPRRPILYLADIDDITDITSAEQNNN